MNSSKSIITALFILLLGSLACSLSAIPAAQPTGTPLPTSYSSPTPTATAPPPTATDSPALLPTATDSPSKPQTVKIFLVAPGDNGQSGKLIGCGDSLVAVEIAIEPTVAVLRAALIELLNLAPDMYFGQSGLYNALYLSNLTIQKLEIVNRQALIHLNGTLIFGGDCDIPLIQAQLTEIALQFSTVDSVSVFINDIPLEEVLSLKD